VFPRPTLSGSASNADTAVGRELPGGSADFKLVSTLAEKYGTGDEGYFDFYKSLTQEVLNTLQPA
jgi:hypothetical protein